MLEHFWIAHFHTKWRRGGHFSFEIPAQLLQAPAGGEAHAPSTDPSQIAPLTDIVGFMLFTASRAGSWEAWRLFALDERQRFLEWAQQEVAHLRKRSWAISVERREDNPQIPHRMES